MPLLLVGVVRSTTYRCIAFTRGATFSFFWTCAAELTVGRGSWVKWFNKFGWITSPADPFYIALIRYHTCFSDSWKTSYGNRNCYFDCLLVPFTIFVTETSRQLRKRSDFLVKAQILLKFWGRKINWCKLNFCAHRRSA